MYFVFQSDPKSGILDLEVINAGKEDISGIFPECVFGTVC